MAGPTSPSSTSLLTAALASASANAPPSPTPRSEVFLGKTFYLYGLNPSDDHGLGVKIKNASGQVVSTFTAGKTDFVVTTSKDLPDKLLSVWLSAGVPLVTPLFIDGSRAKGSLQDPNEYLVLGFGDGDDEHGYHHEDDDRSDAALPFGTSPPIYSLYGPERRERRTSGGPGGGPSGSSTPSGSSSGGGGRSNLSLGGNAKLPRKPSDSDDAAAAPITRTKSDGNDALSHLAKSNLRKEREKTKTKKLQESRRTKGLRIAEDDTAISDRDSAEVGGDGMVSRRPSTPGAIVLTSESAEAKMKAFYGHLQELRKSKALRPRRNKLRLASSEDTSRCKLDNKQLWLELQARLKGCTPSEMEVQIFQDRQRVESVLQAIVDWVPKENSSYVVVSDAIRDLLLYLDEVTGLFPDHAAFRKHTGLYEDAIAKIEVLRTWLKLYRIITTHRTTLADWIIPKGEQSDQPTSEQNKGPFSFAAIESFLMRELRNATISVVFEQRRFRLLRKILDLAEQWLKEDDCTPSQFESLKLPSLYHLLLEFRQIAQSIITVYLQMKIEKNYNPKIEHNNQLSLPSFDEASEMARDIHMSLEMTTTTAHNKYGVIELLRSLGGSPPVDDADLQKAIAKTFEIYFKVLDIKWQAAWHMPSFSIGDFLEEEWSFVGKVSPLIKHGEITAAVGFCDLCEHMFTRITKELDDSDLETTPKGSMRHILRLLETFRWRSRRILRSLKRLGNQLENAIDFRVSDENMAAISHKLEQSMHSIVIDRSKQEPVTTEEGLQIIVSNDLHNKSDDILSVFRVVLSYSTEGLDQDNHDRQDYYVLLVSSDFKWNWKSRQTVVKPEIAQELCKSPTPLQIANNTIRLIAPTSHGLAMAKKKFMKSMGHLLPHSEDTFGSKAHEPKVNKHLLSLKKAAVALARMLIRQANKLLSNPTTFAQPIVAPSPVSSSMYFQVPRRRSNSTSSSRSSSTSTLTPISPSSSAVLHPGTPGPLDTGIEFATLVPQFSEFTGRYTVDVLRFIRGDARRRLQGDLAEFLHKWITFVRDVQNHYQEFNKARQWAAEVINFTENDLVKQAIVQQEPEQFSSMHMLLSSLLDKVGPQDFENSLLTSESRSSLKTPSEREPDETLATMSLDALASADDLLLELAPGERRLREVQALEEDLNNKHIANKVVGRVLSEHDDSSHVQSLSKMFSKSLFRWERKNSLGAGTYGQVYKCINLDTGMLMAVKVIQMSSISTSEDILKSIGEEMRMLETLKHDHIIGYLGMEVQLKEVAVFMEYCSEGSLASVLRRDGPIDKESILQAYTHQIIEGLVYLHGARVVHCDIKPDNILIDSNGRLKLADFGSAVKKSLPNVDAAAKPRKSMEDLRGTPNYMSPELFHAIQPSERSDIWALGCCVWEMIVGKAPWSGHNAFQIIYNVGQLIAPPLPPPSQRLELSQHGRDFLEKCFKIEPEKRATALQLQSHAFLRSDGSRGGHH